MARGDELLIVDGTEAHREGMRSMFDGEGYVCTATGSSSHALELVSSKYFPVALVDLDVDQPAAGLDLLRAIRDRSKATTVIMLTGRRSYEGAVDAFRLGARDVVLKRPEQVGILRDSVRDACERSRAREDDDLLAVVRTTLDASFQVMLDMARKLHSEKSSGASKQRASVLIVDADTKLLEEVITLSKDKPWDLAPEPSGGSALDRAGEKRFDIVVCRDELHDLRGTMVVKTIQASTQDTMALVYSKPGPEGTLARFVEGKPTDVKRPFLGAKDLVQALEDLTRLLLATDRDRRVIRAFREQHADFFRRYAELKQRIDRVAR